MLKFSFPHLFYDNLTSITTDGASSTVISGNLANTTSGELYKGVQTNKNSISIFHRYTFNSIVEYDHFIVSRADLITSVNLSSIRTMYNIPAGFVSDVQINAPLAFHDLRNRDLIAIKPDPTINTSDIYIFITVWSDTIARNLSYSKFILGKFFDFGDNPSDWQYQTQDKISYFESDVKTELITEIDTPRRVFTSIFRGVTDAKLAEFKTYFNQQSKDNFKPYCYLYDSSGRDELLGASLQYVKFLKFDYKKIIANYNEVELQMIEVVG